MANTVTKRDRLQIPPFILIGIWLATGYWVIEAYLDTLFIENVSFAMRLFPSDQNELWMRSLISVFFIGLGLYLHKIHARIRAAEKINVDAAWLLKNAISKTIRGNFPICVSCKKIRNSDGEWLSPQEFITAQTDAEFSCRMCRECLVQHCPDEATGEGQEKIIPRAPQ
jgi:hypothetical protein